MIGTGFWIQVGIALAAALVGGLLARSLRLPTLVGFILAGVTVGPYTPGIFAHPDTIRTVAKLGVALLMFAVGVQFSLRELAESRRVALIGGGIQIPGTILLGVLLGVAFGWGGYAGLFLGCVLAVSSTAVMMRLLEERGELGTGHGTAMLGILIVQDLSVVAMVALLPALAEVSPGDTSAFAAVGQALLLAALFVGGVLFLALRAVPSLLRRVADTGSRELFLLTIVGVCLAAALLADHLGLSLELGAFLAGLVVSESDYADEVFIQLRPLRDVFASLFFVSVGMMLNPTFLTTHWLEILLVVAAIVFGKTLISSLAVLAAGQHGRTAVRAGVGLAQIGEFSFILAAIGNGRGLITEEFTGVVVTSALITILCAPFIFAAGDTFYKRLLTIPALAEWLNRPIAEPERAGLSSEDAPRVLILGAGRVGGHVSKALRAKGVSHRVVEYDARTVARLREAGVSVLYGDASSDTVLARAVTPALELAVIALPEAGATEMAVRALKRLAPHLPVVARVHREEDIARMHAAGADTVIQAEFEAATEMIRQGLDRLGFPDAEVDAYLEGLRQECYRQG